MFYAIRKIKSAIIVGTLACRGGAAARFEARETKIETTGSLECILQAASSVVEISLNLIIPTFHSPRWVFSKSNNVRKKSVECKYVNANGVSLLAAFKTVIRVVLPSTLTLALKLIVVLLLAMITLNIS